jgi:hypothetical protein
LAGASHSFIKHTIRNELLARKYNLVIVLWPEFHHEGIQVTDITQFADSSNTSLYQSQQNDWPEKVIYPINDQNYVDKNWIFNTGYQFSNDSVAKFFKNYFSNVTMAQLFESNIKTIVEVQEILKQYSQPYIFLYNRTFTKFKKFEHVYELIDWDNFYTGDTLMEIASRNNNALMGEDGKYPNAEGNRYYAELLLKQIKSMKLGVE